MANDEPAVGEVTVVERVVAHAVFAYVDPKGVNRMAIRGDKILIDGAELERGERFEVFFTDEDEVVTDPLEGALVGNDEDLDDDDDEDDSDSASAGAQGDDLDGEDVDLGGDELGSTGVVEGSDGRPPRAATKEAWVDFRVAESDGRLSEEQLNGLTKAQLQDDAHVASLLQG